MNIYKHLSYEERVEIRVLRRAGKSIREISRGLMRAPSTVSRELKRNEQFAGTRVIYPNFAQMKANGRRRRAYRKPRLKSKRIRRYVVLKLELGWSPEQISGRMKHDGWEERVSHEAIYQFIYRERRDLASRLARHHKRRKRFGQSKKFKRTPMPNRTDISCRPKQIQAREEFGHWETDLAISQQSKVVLQVSVERKSRLIKIRKIENRTAETCHRALIKTLKTLPLQACKTITYDNGKENVEHTKVNKALGTDSYFCAPYHSWEKGTVENSVGLIRRKYPKKTDFAQVSFKELALLERYLNNKPRKCLQYRTPMELFKEECVALQC